MLSIIIDEIKEIFLKEDGPIRYDENIEGQRIVDNYYVIGPWAGPEKNIYNVFHEMAHFSEREPYKLKEFPDISWGLYFGKYWSIGGQYGYEVKTCQDIMRETRVWAYQLSLLRKFNIKIDIFDLVCSAIYINGWIFYKEKYINDKDCLNKLAKYVEDLSLNNFNYESFISNWNVRIELLRQ